MISGLLSGVQAKLGDEIQKVHMVSITIDPEYDRPERLMEYAKKFNAKPQWQFYSGSVKDVEVLQKAFDVYRGDKMNHSATIFMRAAPDKSWVRLDGFPSSDEVISEFRRLQ
jgi:protein SCO1/2